NSDSKNTRLVPATEQTHSWSTRNESLHATEDHPMTTMLANQTQSSAREIIYRTRGSGGAINRLVSPFDLGEIIKPFVFLDLFEFDQHDPRMSMDHGWHPHSGIATVTVVLEGSTLYAETTGKAGELQAGSVEWMRAGNGVWHTGTLGPGRVSGFQLWV